MDRLDNLKKRHRRLNRLIDNCRARSRQEDMKLLKRLRLRIKDEIAMLRQPSNLAR